MKTISIVNHKGGCGKTTTAISTSAAFAALGYRVLLIDLDPQANATIGLGLDPDSFDRTIYDAITNVKVPLSTVVTSTSIERLDLAPCNIYLASAGLALSGTPGCQLHLAGALTTVADKYDFCIIDCPPALALLTINALVASTDVIAPVQVHYYPLEGLKQLLHAVRILRDRFHPCTVEVLGVLLTFVEERTVLSRQIQWQIRQLLGDFVFDTVIHSNVRLIEAPSAGESIFTYAPDSRAAVDYRSLADEALTRFGIDKTPMLERARRSLSSLQRQSIGRHPPRWEAARTYDHLQTGRTSTHRPRQQGVAEKTWETT
ncbi:MAG: ParA family protein [Sedimentisphaerales bacterium]|nr:ParA family protein [Sedimentisphaerales bacterium]